MSAPPAQPAPTHHPVCRRQQDTGELWAHAIDICQAIGQPLPTLDSERMATLSSSLMAAVPLAMAYRGTG